MLTKPKKKGREDEEILSFIRKSYWACVVCSGLCLVLELKWEQVRVPDLKRLTSYQAREIIKKLKYI